MGVFIGWLLILGSGVTDAAQINPVPLPVVTQTVKEWTFDRGADGWEALSNCQLSTDAARLKVEATGDDPYMACAVDAAGGSLSLTMRIRGDRPGAGSIYWATDRSPSFGEDRVQRFLLKEASEWQEVTALITVKGRLTRLRIDPGPGPGNFEIDSLCLTHDASPPVQLRRIELGSDQVTAQLVNTTSSAQPVSVFGQSHIIQAGADASLTHRWKLTQALEPIELDLRCPDFPPYRRVLFAYDANAHVDWIVRETPEYRLRVAPDGSMACVERGDQVVAVMAPLVHVEGVVPKMALVEGSEAISFRNEEVSLRITCAGDEIGIAIDSLHPCEGPVVRLLGALKQGLLPGLEYLGPNEASSSTLDVRTREHLRFMPDPLLLTMPMMAVATDRGSVAMTWTDTSLQPTFATPNFFDGSDDHRMSLRGRAIKASISVNELPMDEVILRSVKQRGLPPLPSPPRTAEDQRTLYLAALDGPLKSDKGWGHCVEDHWPRQPYADMASTIWRLSGELPDLPATVPGGAHIPNGTIYFLTGRAQEWIDYQRHRAASHREKQQADGSFRYDGRYREGHFEDTAVGICAAPAVTMLETVRLTGDPELLAAASRTLDYMKRFDVPRGAQTWEVPLHTPDQLAAAYAVWAYVRGYELTGREDYKEQARRWATSGIPFVYLWGCHPVMLYGTPPVFGATNWEAPVWIGLPVQWVGVVYAYSLTMLAPHDASLDWNHLAKGILIAAQQMQYPDGPNRGLLPDSMELRGQSRRPWNINPCSLVSLQLAVEGQTDFLSVAQDGAHRVAAPFPVSIQGGAAHIRARPGLDYQVVIDGRVVDVHSRGEDAVPLE